MVFFSPAVVLAQSLPYTPPDFNDPNCMLDDPWVWEDFGGPISCFGPTHTALPPRRAANEADTPGECSQSVAIRSQAVVTWAQMKAAEASTSLEFAPELENPCESGVDFCPPASSPESLIACATGNGTAPSLGLRFPGGNFADTADEYPVTGGVTPPDTMGAIGPRHFVQAINGFLGVYDKINGRRTRDTTLRGFFAGIPDTGVSSADVVNDPRVLFDQHSQRWIVAAFKGQVPGNLIVLAVSLTDDPTGSWFQVSFRSEVKVVYADHPTLGVDSRAIYVATDNPTGSQMDELWAIEKAPLLAQPPHGGFVRHWLSRPIAPASPLASIERALQPAHTYGTPGAEYLVQVASDNSALEVYRVVWPAGPGCPTLTYFGLVDVEDFMEPGDAPALTGFIDVASAGARLIMAVYRDGFLWTCHTIGLVTGRSACRWYKIDVSGAAPTLAQCGLVTDDTLHYYYPSLMVNALGEMAMGFSGSDENQPATAYYTGRTAAESESNTDMAIPQVLKAGEGLYCDGVLCKTVRWGDYSYTTLDPDDEETFWTIQEYVKIDSSRPPGQQDIWSTWIGQLSFAGFDCDNDGTSDAVEISGGTSLDCNLNGKPDNCELSPPAALDCNGNGTPDTCDIAAGTSLDCNGNRIPDSCDLAAGTSVDCNANNTPFECEIVPDTDCNRNCTADAQDVPPIGALPDCNQNLKPDSCDGADCNGNFILDACDISAGTSQDCDGNGVPDSCNPADCDNDGTPSACEDDCNANGVADDCDIAQGISKDCPPANGVPDECDPHCAYVSCFSLDCNLNGVFDAADIASGVSLDNSPANGIPDECDSVNNIPAACVTRVVSWKDHLNKSNPEDEYVEVNLAGRIQFGNVTSEPRWTSQSNNAGGIKELRVTFDVPPAVPGSSPAVMVLEQDRIACGASCPGGEQVGYGPYTGASTTSASVNGSTLVLTFSPALENTRTYKFRVNSTITRIASQVFEVRCLMADVNSSGRVDAIDRSVVVGVWTGAGYSARTDIDLSGITNSVDRSIVVGVWTGSETGRCAP